MLKNFAGIDVQAMYPAHPAEPSLAAGWTYDTFLKAAEACHKAGYPFGMGLGQTGTRSTTPVRYSTRSGRSWWMPRERSRSNPTTCDA